MDGFDGTYGFRARSLRVGQKKDKPRRQQTSAAAVPDRTEAGFELSPGEHHYLHQFNHALSIEGRKELSNPGKSTARFILFSIVKPGIEVGTACRLWENCGQRHQARSIRH